LVVGLLGRLPLVKLGRQPLAFAKAKSLLQLATCFLALRPGESSGFESGVPLRGNDDFNELVQGFLLILVALQIFRTSGKSSRPR
jgi:hypothetical protein